MSDLKLAHHGYSYQDLLGAIAAVDVILGSVERLWCDTRLCGDHDKFDDMTIEETTGRRLRRQIKHQLEPRVLDVDTFVRDRRDLLLSKVLRGIRADEAAFPDQVERSFYTILMRDTDAEDEVLTKVLVPANPDPGPSVPGTETTRYRFDTDALWAGVHRPGAGRRQAGDAWEFLRVRAGGATKEGGDISSAAAAYDPSDRVVDAPEVSADDAARVAFTHEELVHLCERLVVEVNSPAMSSDFAAPGPMEQILLARLRAEVGVGEYPNESRRPEDVAALLVAAVTKARQTHEPLTRTDVLHALALRTDYGSVSRRSPAEPDQQVSRQGAVEDLRGAIEHARNTGGFVLAQAVPGQGKSWVADQLRSVLLAANWTVAEHYCFLNDSEDERDDRVTSERIFGSLMERVASEHPDLASKQRPIFSADEQSLMQLVSRVVDEHQTQVVLIVDGLDHVTRVRGDKPGTMPASEALAARIAELDPPPGCVIVVLSQPGGHLDPLVAMGAATVSLPPMDQDEIDSLADRLGLFAQEELNVERAEVSDHRIERRTGRQTGLSEDEHAALVRALFERSAGNPLYATYLVRELMRAHSADRDLLAWSAADVLTSIPAYDGDLEHYYVHLAGLLDDAGQAAADTLTLVDFPLSEEELKEIQPGQGHRIARAVRVLEPVLRTSARGLTIYHESFARFLRRELDDEPAALAARIDAVVTWLGGLGLLRDTRSFASMLPLMAAAGRTRQVLDIVDRSFAAAAVGAGFPPSAIRANLAVAVRCAQRDGDWPAVLRCLELMRGVETYEQERLADLDVRFVDVRLALFGGAQIVDRMLRDGLVVIPPDAGLLLCAQLDRAGLVPPWRPYLTAWLDQREDHDRAPEPDVVAAWLRGRLRLVSTESPGATVSSGAEARRRDHSVPAEPGAKHEVSATIGGPEAGSEIQAGDADPLGEGPEPEVDATDLDRVLATAVAWCEHSGELERCRIVVETVAEVLGLGAVAAIAETITARGAFLLAVAEELHARGGIELEPYGSPAGWAAQSAVSGAPVGHRHRLRDLGVELVPMADAAALQTALDAARALLDKHSSNLANAFLDALDVCRERSVALDAVTSALAGEGWFRCWLRFCVDLVRAEAVSAGEADARSALAMQALERLNEDPRPFAGEPRAVDMYQEMGLIWDTVARSVNLLTNDDWPRAIELLLTVGRSVTGSIDGEMGVPLPPDRTLQLGLETVPDEHVEFLIELIGSEIEISRGRFYSDISEFHMLEVLCHLRRAETADVQGDNDLAAEAREQASEAWTSASSMLLAYGFHKDITVFEVLDPLESLLQFDSGRGLQRMVPAYDLAYRAWRHSDGRETRHAPLRWWRMLAAADPIAHAEQSLREGLATRGERTRWEQMRQDLWNGHALDADPVAATIMAATLMDAPRTTIYPDVLQRLEACLTNEEDRCTALLRRALARGDEVALTSDNDGQSSQVNDIVTALNELASVHNWRAVLGDVTAEIKNGQDDPDHEASSLAREEENKAVAALATIEELAQETPDGVLGVAVLVRSWRREGANAARGSTSDQLIEAYAQALTPRLVAVLDTGHVAEVSTVLETLAEVTSFAHQHRLLVRIGGLLESAAEAREDDADAQQLRREAAARAFALAWTQARGDGGWLAFGGREYMNLLSRASSIVPEVASEAVGIAVERSLNGLRGNTLGVTKALIEALGAGALVAPGERDALDVAFDAWDEAFAVISSRLPTLPAEEDSDCYDGKLHETPVVEPRLSPTDYAFALSAFAGLSHPGRENLRRTMLALEDLARLRPVLFAQALPAALESMSGAVVPLLVLSMLDRLGSEDESLLEAAKAPLMALLNSPYLAVRALARRLLTRLTDQELPAPVSDPGGKLGASESSDKNLAYAASLLQETPFRVAAVNDQVDGGLIGTVMELIAQALDDEQFHLDLQRAGRDMGNKEWPNALLLSDHVSEESLQRAAGGLLVSITAHGTEVVHAVEWEDDLASLLQLSALPVMVEKGRVPRPDIAVPPSTAGAQQDSIRSPEPEPWLPHSGGPGGPCADWVLLAYCETRRSDPTKRRDAPDVRTQVVAGVELDCGQATHRAEMPVGSLSVVQWFNPVSMAAGDPSEDVVPLATHARAVGQFADDDARLGLPAVLAPSPELVGALGLSGATLDESADLVMTDAVGPALAHVVWRSSYSHSDYHMSYPRLTGSALLLRPDLVQALVDKWGERLTWRTWVDCEQSEMPQAR